MKICCQYLEGQHNFWKEIRTGSDSIKEDSKGAFVGELEYHEWYDVLKRDRIYQLFNIKDLNNERKDEMIKKMAKICLKLRETV